MQRRRTPTNDAVILITGGAGDIGLAVAKAYAAQGARLALLDLAGPRLDAAVASIPGARGFACDVTDAAACEVAVNSVLAAWGKVDIVILSAGSTHRSLFADTDLSVIHRVMNVNFWGSVNVTRAVLPALRASRGTVAAISSVAGFAPLIGRTGYAASKHALHGFFDSLRTEVASDGVHVLVVCPSFVDTAFAQRALDGAGKTLSGTRAVAGKPITPEHVATAIVNAVARRQRTRLIAPVAHLSWWLSRLAPPLYDRMMRRAQRSEFS